MKRKAIVLLSSVLAGALLVGGAFAAYAVTDNADPLGFVATPGTYEEDQTKYLTMKFGDSSALDNVENMEVGHSYRAGAVSLESTVKYTGLFTVTLTDRTEREDATAKKLIDYLRVDIFEGAHAAAEEATVLPTGSPLGSVGYYEKEVEEEMVKVRTTTDTFELAGLPGGKEYAIYVTVDNDAKIYYSQMVNDEVYIEVDWNPKSGDLSTSYTVFAEKQDGWSEVWVYAWGETGENAVFPGKKMELYRDDIYTSAIPNGFKNVIFSAGDNDKAHQSEDLTMTTAHLEANEVYWNGGLEWHELPKALKPASGYKVNEVVMVENEEDPLHPWTDGRLTEFKALAQTVTAGQQLSFFSVEGEVATAITADITYEGNVDSTGKIKTAGEVDIYIKIYAGTGDKSGRLVYSVYVSGEAAKFLFTNSRDWSDVYLYAFNNEEDHNAEWPGVKLTAEPELNEFEQTQFALDWGSYAKFVLTNGSGEQTVDILASSLAGLNGIYLDGTQTDGNYNIATF